MNGQADITVETPCPGWRDTLTDYEALCRDAALAALAAAPLENCPAMVEVGIRLTDDGELRDLNGRFRGIDAATNVLAFAMTDDAAPPPSGPPLALGDVVLAFETVADEAAAQGKSLADHLTHLVIHGMLHLLGHDHRGAAQADVMESLETVILAGLGIADPYAPDADRRLA